MPNWLASFSCNIKNRNLNNFRRRGTTRQGRVLSTEVEQDSRGKLSSFPNSILIGQSWNFPEVWTLTDSASTSDSETTIQKLYVDRFSMQLRFRNYQSTNSETTIDRFRNHKIERFRNYIFDQCRNYFRSIQKLKPTDSEILFSTDSETIFDRFTQLFSTDSETIFHRCRNFFPTDSETIFSTDSETIFDRFRNYDRTGSGSWGACSHGRS